MKVIVKMTDFVTTKEIQPNGAKVGYMYHCHFLEHEDDGMMGQFAVTGEVNSTVKPDFKQVLTVYGGIMYGEGVHNFSFDTLLLNTVVGSTYVASNPLVIRLSKNDAIRLTYDSTMTNFKGNVVENNLWRFDDSDTFDYVLTYLGNTMPTNQSRFAITGTFTVEKGEVGRFILESTLNSGTGNDTNIDNNSDRDTLQKNL